jgi:hypothetical protein
MRTSTSRRRAKRGRGRSALDNAVLDTRTTYRLGKLLWRPLLGALWARRVRRRQLAHR